MLLSAVSVLVVAQSSSEIPDGLMNNPVYEVATIPYWKPLTDFKSVDLEREFKGLLFGGVKMALKVKWLVLSKFT